MTKKKSPAKKTPPETPKGPQAKMVALRPSNYDTLSGEEQWEIDKGLGILDWNGDPNT